MAKRVVLDDLDAHKICLAIERVNHAYETLRDEQVELVYLVGNALDSRRDWVFWLLSRLLFEDGAVVSESDFSSFILRVLRYAKLRPRDLDARCDLRPCTERQQRAIEKLGGKRKEYTYSQAETLIRKAQKSDRSKTVQRQPNARSRTKVCGKR